MNRIESAAKNGLLLTIVVLVTLLIAEVMLSAMSIGSYSRNRGLLYYTAPSFQKVGDKGINYEPNKAIRTVAVYGDQIDYDTTNQTNNLGFYDNIPYTKASPGVKGEVFVGDSFTAGSGGTKPWVAKLRESLKRPDLAFYNLGVSGTGIFNFYELLLEMKDEISIDRVNIMLITSDFYRSLWYPYYQKEGLRFCPTTFDLERCKSDTAPTMLPLEMDETKDSVLDRSIKFYSDRGRDWDNRDLPFYQKLRIYTVGCQAMYRFKGPHKYGPSEAFLTHCPQLGLYKTRYEQKDQIYINSIETLKKMQMSFPDVEFRVFHIPEKSEVVSTRHFVNISKDIEAIGMQYILLLSSCDWQLSMYHKHDGHFNDRGYTSMAECMAQYM